MAARAPSIKRTRARLVSMKQTAFLMSPVRAPIFRHSISDNRASPRARAPAAFTLATSPDLVALNFLPRRYGACADPPSSSPRPRIFQHWPLCAETGLWTPPPTPKSPRWPPQDSQTPTGVCMSSATYTTESSSPCGIQATHAHAAYLSFIEGEAPSSKHCAREASQVFHEDDTSHPTCHPVRHGLAPREGLESTGNPAPQTT